MKLSAIPVLSQTKVGEQDAALLLIVYFAFFTSGMMSTLLGAVLPAMTEEYGLNYVLGGMMLSAHQIGNLAAVLIAGFLPYIIGRKKSTVGLCTGIVIGLVLTTLTGNPVLLLIAFGATGVGRGTMSNISNVIVSETTGNKTAGLNLLHACFAVGALIAPVVTIAASAVLPHGWKFAVYVVAAFEVAALICLAGSKLSNTPPLRHPARTSARPAADIQTSADTRAHGSADTRAPESGRTADTVPFFKSYRYWLNTMLLFFYLCGESAIVGWLVTYFKDSGLMGQAFAQSTSTFLWIMIMAGRLFCASISGKTNRNVLILILAAAQTVFFILMISTRNMALIITGLLGTGLSMSGIYPTTMSTMPQQYLSSTVATGTCIATATIGAILMPIIVGAVAETAGIAGGIAAISFALAIMLLLAAVKTITSRRCNFAEKTGF